LKQDNADQNERDENLDDMEICCHVSGLILAQEV
jgi:hypothetical protein